MNTFNIILGHAGEVHLEYEVFDNLLGHKWVERMTNALESSYPLDNRHRFYRFSTPEEETQHALGLINDAIAVINNYSPLVEREIHDLNDQDTLNYLHKIFEDWHGLLGTQDTEFWNNAPAEVQKALADLNIHVHRCELTRRKMPKTFTCTWYGLPKDKQFTHNEMLEYGELDIKAGGLYFNYVEVGKTLEDICKDEDDHAGEAAYLPFIHYSADFHARFESKEYTEEYDNKLYECYQRHKDIFASNGYDNFEILKPYRYRFAQLKGDPNEYIDQIRTHQYVKDVYFS